MPLDTTLDTRTLASAVADQTSVPPVVKYTTSARLALPLPQPQPLDSDRLELLPPVLDQTVLDLPARCGIEDLHAWIEQDDRGKWDLTIPRDRLALAHGQLILPEEMLGDCPECLTLSPWATAQACARLGIPASYFTRCPAPLQDAQFNHWAWRQDGEPESEDMEAGCSGGNSHHPPRPWLLRCQDQSVRAVLSDRYAPLDNAELLAHLAPLARDRHFEVRALTLTPESLHLRLVDPRLGREVLPDDRLIAGVHIANSEVGRRSVTVDALVWRLVCQNGLVRLVKGRSLLRQRHVSWDRPRFAEALGRAVSEAITAGAGLIERLSAATREPVPDIEGVIRAIGQQAALTQSVQEQVRLALLGTPPSQAETVYGLTQALTFVAQSLSPDDRYDLEVTAGRLLDEGLPSPIKPGSLKAGGADSRASQSGRQSGGSAHG